MRDLLTGLDLVDDADVLRGLSHDEAEWAPYGTAVAAVRPRTTDDVRRTVAACAQRGVPIVPRGAGTGLSGGANAVDGAVIIDLSRMNRIVEVDADNMTATVQAGVVNDDLKKAVAEHGLWYPPDPASAPWSTIGGNVSTNAGGLCCLKYGVTRDYVLGLEAVVGGPAGDYGTVVRLGRRTTKGGSGYDLAGVFTGSGGTVGGVTRVTRRLRAAPPGGPPPPGGAVRRGGAARGGGGPAHRGRRVRQCGRGRRGGRRDHPGRVAAGRARAARPHLPAGRRGVEAPGPGGRRGGAAAGPARLPRPGRGGRGERGRRGVP